MVSLSIPNGINSITPQQIPQQWSSSWFYNFVQTWLAPADIRNAQSTSVVVTGNGLQPATIETIDGFSFNSATGDTQFNTGNLDAPMSTLSPTITRIETGLASFRVAPATDKTGILNPDPELQITFREIANFAFEIFLPVYGVTSGACGFQFDINSPMNTAVLSSITYGVQGWSTGSAAAAAVTSVATANSYANITSSSSAPSWFLAKGFFGLTASGVLGVRWAQNSASTNPCQVLAGAYFQATKIG